MHFLTLLVFNHYRALVSSLWSKRNSMSLQLLLGLKLWIFISLPLLYLSILSSPIYYSSMDFSIWLLLRRGSKCFSSWLSRLIFLLRSWRLTSLLIWDWFFWAVIGCNYIYILISSAAWVYKASGGCKILRVQSWNIGGRLNWIYTLANSEELVGNQLFEFEIWVRLRNQFIFYFFACC